MRTSRIIRLFNMSFIFLQAYLPAPHFPASLFQTYDRLDLLWIYTMVGQAKLLGFALLCPSTYSDIPSASHAGAWEAEGEPDTALFRFYFAGGPAIGNAGSYTTAKADQFNIEEAHWSIAKTGILTDLADTTGGFISHLTT